jgi:hypothetical protein
MTQLSNGTIVTDIDAAPENAALTAQGYTTGAIETWHVHDTTGTRRGSQKQTCPTERAKTGRSWYGRPLVT